MESVLPILIAPPPLPSSDVDNCDAFLLSITGIIEHLDECETSTASSMPDLWVDIGEVFNDEEQRYEAKRDENAEGRDPWGSDKENTPPSSLTFKRFLEFSIENDHHADLWGQAHQ